VAAWPLFHKTGVLGKKEGYVWRRIAEYTIGQVGDLAYVVTTKFPQDICRQNIVNSYLQRIKHTANILLVRVDFVAWIL
jgi:hypothetical protein